MSLLSGITSSFRLPSLNLGGIAKSVLSNVTKTLSKTAGSFFKSGFDAAKQTLFGEIGKMLGIKPPSAANIGAPGAPPAAGGGMGIGGAGNSPVANAAGNVNLGATNPEQFIRDNMGGQAADLFKQLPPEQQKEMAMQAAIQRTARISQLMSNILQTLHDMSKAIIQNTRG
ncbi:MAG TPA: hypothetical protein VLQ93_21740 [Myxococcaceae bacterium]|nr:hypothetical protein [Myxococcaceae bacterium]